MMTESEARKKWCPFAVPFGTEGGTRAKDGSFTEPTRCLASECMAWRWGIEGYEGECVGAGFCGMASAPRQ